MINDAGRNSAYVNALKSILSRTQKRTKNSVLDLGSGTGLLGIAAAKLGSEEKPLSETVIDLSIC